MSDAEYIKALEKEIRQLQDSYEESQRARTAAQETIKATVALNAKLEQRVETMRQIACAIAANTNKIQRIAAGETE